MSIKPIIRQLFISLVLIAALAAVAHLTVSPTPSNLGSKIAVQVKVLTKG